MKYKKMNFPKPDKKKKPTRMHLVIIHSWGLSLTQFWRVILITQQSRLCFMWKHPDDILIAASVKQMHMPEERVAFIKENISMGTIDAKGGEMMEALMGIWRPTKAPHPTIICQDAGRWLLSLCCQTHLTTWPKASLSIHPMTTWPYLKADMMRLWANW